MFEAFLLPALMYFLFIYISVVVYVVKRKDVELFDPMCVYLFFFLIFTLPLPIRVFFTTEIEGDITSNLPEILPYIPVALALAATSLFVFVAGYHSRIPERIVRMVPIPGPPSPGLTYVSILILAGFSFILLAILSNELGGIGRLVLLGYDSSSELTGKGYLAIGIPWLFVAILLLLYRYARYRSAFDLMAFLVLFLMYSGVSLIMGNRTSIVYTVLVVVIFVHFAIRRIPLRSLIPLMVAAFLALNVFGYLRESNYGSLGDFADRMGDNFSKITESGELTTALTYTLTSGQFVVPFETFPQIIKSAGAEVDYTFGLSFIQAPLFLVPQVLFPERPLPLSNWYMQTFYGSGYGLNQGRGFYFLSEGYLSFGFAGVFLLQYFWGIMLGTLNQYRLKAREEPGAMLLFALSNAFLMRGIGGVFMSIVVGLPQQALVPAVLGLALMGAWGRKEAGNVPKVLPAAPV